MTPQDPNFPEEFSSVPPPGPPEQTEAGVGNGEGEPGLAPNAGEPVPPEPVPPEPVPPEPVPPVPVPPAPMPPVPPDPQLGSQAEPVYTSQRQPPRAAAQPSRVGRSPAPPGDASKNNPGDACEDVWGDSDIAYQPKQLGVVDQLLLLLAEGATVWKKVLRWVRSQLPPDLQRKLPDAILTAIALGLMMLLLALWNPLGAGGGERAVASEPLPPITATEPEPQDLFAEPAAEPPSAAEPLESPPAAPEPTPEQSLIADIQDRVSRISRSYGAGLVQSVEVNLPENTLGVNLAEAWYGLPITQQNEVAQDIYAQAQGLEFGTLQLRDPNGVVVARNPVVGPNMVVLRRLRSP